MGVERLIRLPFETGTGDILTDSAVKCLNCSKLNDSDANYCIECGSALKV
jgi:hypothetical protein